MLKSYLIFLFIGLSLLSCKAEKGALRLIDRTNPFQANAVISGNPALGFENLQKFILKPKCMNCHSTKAGRVEPDLDPIDFDTYESTMSPKFIPLLKKGHPDKSRLYDEVFTGNMPIKERLHDKEIAYIANWIKACAPKEETTTIPETCEDDSGGDDDDFGDEDDFDNDDFEEDNDEEIDEFDNDEF